MASSVGATICTCVASMTSTNYGIQQTQDVFSIEIPVSPVSVEYFKNFAAL